MKILHTSDWHLGHSLYGYDRSEEQGSMLRQMAEIVEKERPDVFLLCGDVYHTSQPSAAVQRQFSEAMVALHLAHPDMKIIVTAGNHDSASRHEVFRTPWLAINVHAIGTVDPEDPERHIVSIPGKGHVIAVPYCHERNLPDGFFQSLLYEVERRNTDGLPVVLTAHTTICGCDFSGHDNSSEYMVGGIDSLDIDELGKGYDYLALGHIHHAQFVHTGRHNVRYCGTPLPVSFDENYPHSISMVRIGSHGCRPEVTTIGIENPWPLVTLPSEGTLCWEEARQALAEFPSDIRAYVRLTVATADYLPSDAFLTAAALCADKECRFCQINVRRTASAPPEEKALTIQEFQEADPLDIARRYAEDSGVEFDEDMEALFREAMRKAAAPQ